MRAHAAGHLDELMTEFAREEDHGLRCWLLELMGEAGSARALPLLAAQLHEDDEALRCWAAAGPRLMNTPDSLSILYKSRTQGPGQLAVRSRNVAAFRQGIDAAQTGQIWNGDAMTDDIDHPDIRYVVYPVHRDGTPTGRQPRMRHDLDCGHFKWPDTAFLGTPIIATPEQMKTLPPCKDCARRTRGDLP